MLYYDDAPLRRALANLDIRLDVDVEASYKFPKSFWSDISNDFRTEMELRTYRDDFVKKYAWAIPSREAINAVASYSPLIEIGAGTGFWASLLQEAGADILAFDLHPPRQNNITVHESRHTDVKYGGAPQAQNHPERTLFLCWPPYDMTMADDCLRLYTGDHVVYIGEGYGGCTGNERFHRRLAREWMETKHLDLPQWPYIHDYLAVYQRK